MTDISLCVAPKPRAPFIRQKPDAGKQLARFALACQPAIRRLSARHEWLADLAHTFPGLLFALAVPRAGFDAEQAIAGVMDGARLLEIARLAQVPRWLRRLPPEAFRSPLGRLPDGAAFSTQIVNHLPASAREAADWLQTVALAAEVADDEAALWVARGWPNWPRYKQQAPKLYRNKRMIAPIHIRQLALWSWYSRQPCTLAHDLIEQRWTPQSGIKEAFDHKANWLQNISLHLAFQCPDISEDWMHAGTFGGLDFVRLNSRAEIVEEAREMRNCLRTYGSAIASNQSQIWSIRRDGRRVATVGLNRHWDLPMKQVEQIRGPDNATAPPELLPAVFDWLRNSMARPMPEPRSVTSEPKISPTVWQALWKPYWQAKRRIPVWLPMMPGSGDFWDF